jgi:hypothetical protein
MFEQAGHKVTSREVLSPKLRRADCIVWFPDDFQPPSKKVRRWLEDWLNESPQRTLIYVGRDFDAAPWYWEKVAPLAPPEQAEAVQAQLKDAKLFFQWDRDDIPKSEDCEWFTIKGKQRPRKVRSLKGEPQWLDGVEPAELEIELFSRIVPSPMADVLLASEDDVLVSTMAYDESQLIVVANGSFLLNAPLVNHEHRKLAGKLIEQIGKTGQNVAFLESWRGGPAIHETDPVASNANGLEIFHLWPTNWVLLHLSAVGILFCYSRWPIFGLPRQPDAAAVSDFGKHIDSLAELLAHSRDRAYAMSRVSHYQQTVKTNAKSPAP